jgi:hypothetical protein
MRTLSRKIGEDLGFPKVITAKQVSGKNLKTESWSSIWTLETILPELKNFCKFTHLYNKLCGTLYILGVWSNLIPITSEKLQTKLNDPHYTELDNFDI